MTHVFKTYLRQVARETAALLSQFEKPPAFDLWQNPVTAAAAGFETLRDESREQETGYLFHASNASGLTDDGRCLLDGGITNQRRLWLLYRYCSLTDFDGNSEYTSVNAAVSTILIDGRTIDLCFGFDWLLDESLSRLSFEHDETKIISNVLSPAHWRALHRLQVAV